MKVKKLLALALSVSMLAGMSISSFADSGLTIGSSITNQSEDSLFISSDSVPSGAEDYAIKIFESLTPTDISILGIGNNATEIRLAHGFTVNNTDVLQYYFPLMENNKIVAIMIVNDHGNSYGFQLGSSELSDNLNNLETDYNNPAQIYVSESAYYCVDKNGVNVLDSIPEASNEILDAEAKEIENTFNTIQPMHLETTVDISSDNVYDAHIKEIEPYTLMGKKHTVACVDNWVYTQNNTTHGTCWASCVGSLVDYFEDGKANTTTAKNYRDMAKNEQKNTTGSYSASSSDAVKYINKYSGSSLTYRRELPSWSTIKSILLTKKAPSGQKGMPFYSHWENLRGTAAHSMVICGYHYENTKPNDESYYSIYLMDPNEQTIQLLQYRDSYTVAKELYSWEGSGR